MAFQSTTRRAFLQHRQRLPLPFSFGTTQLSTSSNDNVEREFRQKQKQMSDQVRKETATTQLEHVEHQARLFDELASFYASEEATLEEVLPILTEMAESMIDSAITNRQAQREQDQDRPARVNATFEENVYHILDVGCGAGALFDFYLQAAEARDITVRIQGLDLAPNMVEKAVAHGKELLQETDKPHSISAQAGDIGTYTTDASQQYDLAVANACFGNFWDRTQALGKMADSLRLGGLLCITHPLGSDFVEKLHEEDSSTVPHLLPANVAEFEQLARTLPLQVKDVKDKPTHSHYMATAARVVSRTLPQIIRLRGEVDSGYGRGGKKLGFPTANLPSRLFQNALQDIQCGVYFGWAVLEKDGIAHKAVVNVGYSPTFEGQENPEKIVEAHLMVEDTLPDFYGQVMRLQLIGFLRPEIKFPSFPALIAQITTDVQDAKDALSSDDYTRFQKDAFVSSPDQVWIGEGGNETASWEFEPVEDELVEPTVMETEGGRAYRDGNRGSLGFDI